MKRKYLYRLTMIMISLLFVPIVIISTLFWRNSLKELKIANDTYQEKLLSSYVSVLDKTIEELREQAAFVSAESKESDSSMFDGVQGLKEDYFRLYQISKELIDINPYMGMTETEWGIYLYETGRIVKPGVTTTVEDFIYDMEKTGFDCTELDDFFSRENFKWSQTAFCTTRNAESGLGSLMLGVYTHIGTYQDEALIYFEIPPIDMQNAMPIIDEGNINFRLVANDSQKVLLSWGKSVTEEGDVYKKETTIPNVSIEAYLSGDTLQQNMYEYASGTGKLMLLLGILLFGCCLGAVYMSYRPIRELTSNLDYENEEAKGSEIEVIKNVMERDRSIIEKQEGTIKDLLLSHLLYGGHISIERMKHLGVDEEMKYYGVFVLSGILLDAEKASELVAIGMKQFAMRLFVISLVEQNKSVLVLFAKTEDFGALHEMLQTWLALHEMADVNIYPGKVVERLDDIQVSFKTAAGKEKRALELEQRQLTEDTNTKAGKQKKLINDILTYLDENFKDATLGQVQVADVFQISNYTLSRMFKSYMNIGFAEYLIEKRLSYAKYLLLETNDSINDIAIKSGFSSVHYFSRMFKTSLGVTPSAFRKTKGQV